VTTLYAIRGRLRVVLVRVLQLVLTRRGAFKLLGIPAGPSQLERLEQTPVHEAACYLLPPPRTVEPQLHPSFTPGVDIDHSVSGWMFERSFVVTVPGGTSRSTGFNFTSSGELLELGKGLIPLEPGTYDRWFRPLAPVPYIDDTVATLTTFWDMNYFHWLFDVLPRLRLLERAGMQPRWIYASLRHTYQRDSLLKLGYDQSMIVDSSKVAQVSAKTLIVPSLPGIPGVMHKWVGEYIKRGLAPAASSLRGPRRRIYISRAGAKSRRITNETQVMELLAQYGFTVLKPETMTLDEQVHAFQSAECVVAPHGAALSNVVFCEPGTPVIEVLPPERMILCYWVLSQQMSLTYYYLLASSVTAEDDMAVDVGKLKRTLDLALTSSDAYHRGRATGISA
jgi:hypothetical protein